MSEATVSPSPPARDWSWTMPKDPVRSQGLGSAKEVPFRDSLEGPIRGTQPVDEGTTPSVDDIENGLLCVDSPRMVEVDYSVPPGYYRMMEKIEALIAKLELDTM